MTADVLTILNLFPGSAFRNKDIKDPLQWLKKTMENIVKVEKYIKKSPNNFNEFYPYYFDPNIIGVE